MRWCCLTFKSWYEAAGERGAAILVWRSSAGAPLFVIQHRAVDQGLESSVKSENPVTVVSDIYIDYCPWCGRNLKKTYGKHVDALFRPNLKVLIPGVDD
jgi:hypothetical protein